jgi:hypothetical protein
MSTTSKRLLLAAAVAVTAITARVETPFAQNNVSSAAQQQGTLAQAAAAANADPASSVQKAKAEMTARRASVPQTKAQKAAAAAMSKATADATSQATAGATSK